MLPADSDKMRCAGIAEGGVHIIGQVRRIADDSGLNHRRNPLSKFSEHFINVPGNSITQLPQCAGGIPNRRQPGLCTDKQHIVGGHLRTVGRHAQRRLKTDSEPSGGQICTVSQNTCEPSGPSQAAHRRPRFQPRDNRRWHIRAPRRPCPSR